MAFLRPTKVGRAFPMLAILALGWVTSTPGWDDGFLYLGAILLLSCVLSLGVWWGAILYVRRRGYAEERVIVAFDQHWRKVARAAAIAMVLVILRPMLFMRFWISRPWLDRVAQRILAQPFSQSTPYIGQVRGLYRIGDTRRCPHGVKLMLTQSYGGIDGGPGFFYRVAPGDCTRFEIGMPLGDGWYVSE